MSTKTLGILVEAQGAAKAAGLIGKVDQSVQKLGSRTGLIGRFSSGIGKATSRIGGLVSSLGPLAGVAGIAGLTGLITSSIGKAEEFGVTVSKLQGILNLDAETVSALSDTLDKYGIAGDKQVTVLGRMEKNVAALTVTQGKAKASTAELSLASQKLRLAQAQLNEIEHKKGASASQRLSAQIRVNNAERALVTLRQQGTKATSAAAEFQKKYGFNLLGTNGKVADANTLLLRSADYFKSNASATNKATVLNKLYGKTWTEMIPVLSLGSKGIKEEEKNAIHLTATQLGNISKFKVAQREFGDIIGDLQVKIGADLMPMITSALGEASNWLDTHGDEVEAFFRDAGQFGGQLASDIRSVFGAIQSGWNLIPAPLRTLLIEGLVAGKVTKFLFDFGPMDFAKLGAKLFGGVAGGLLQRGGTPANPLFVADVTGGLGGVAGGAGGLAGAGGGSLLTAAGGIFIAGIAPFVLADLATAVAGGPEGVAQRDTAGRQATAAARGIPGVVPTRPAAGPINVAGAWYQRQAAGATPPKSMPAAANTIGVDARTAHAFEAIANRARAAGKDPTQRQIAATFARNADRQEQALRDQIAAIKDGDNRIVAAIKGIPVPIVSVTASDIQRVQVQRRNAVKAHGSRNSRIGGPTATDS